MTQQATIPGATGRSDVWQDQAIMMLTPLALRLIGDWHYGRWLRFQHFKRVVRDLPLDLSTAQILDVGCGQGDYALWLGHRYPHSQILAIDHSSDNIKECRGRAAKLSLSNVRFEALAVEELNLPDMYDFAYCSHVLEYVDDSAALRRLASALRPGAILLIDAIARPLGTSRTFGLRRFMQNQSRPAGMVRDGYTEGELGRLLEGNGMRVLGQHYAMGPIALFAHTVFELLRRRHLRRYLALLPALKLAGYTDFLFPPRTGASLMMWAVCEPSPR